jgi:eukaryotic-like serine/threonine-protein kinase
MKNIFKLGDLIHDRYQIIKIIGRGNIGITYAANDLKLRQKVAIKTVFLTDITDWKILELFEREAKVLANLNHPNIPKYLDYFQENYDQESFFCLVQELIEGESLAKLVKNKRKFSENEIKNIARQILQILVYLQELNPPIIHRDLKPQNIILTPENQVYLVDFGTVQDVYRNTVSIGGTFVGTFGYMSPEQFRGQTLLSSDLYSLGASLIFLITEKSPADLPQKNLKIDFTSTKKISYTFSNWLAKMVEPIAEDRFNYARIALEELDNSVNSIITPFSERINIYRQAHQLVIKINPLGWQFPTILTLFQGIIFNYFLVISPWFNLLKYMGKNGLLSVNFGLVILLFLVTLIGCYLVILFLEQLLGYVIIDLTNRKLRIIWKSPTMNEHKLRNTVDISRLEMKASLTGKYNQSYSFILWYGIKPYTIATHLTRLEAKNLLNYFDQFLTENGFNIDIKM